MILGSFAQTLRDGGVPKTCTITAVYIQDSIFLNNLTHSLFETHIILRVSDVEAPQPQLQVPVPAPGSTLVQHLKGPRPWFGTQWLDLIQLQHPYTSAGLRRCHNTWQKLALTRHLYLALNPTSYGPAFKHLLSDPCWFGSLKICSVFLRNNHLLRDRSVVFIWSESQEVYLVLKPVFKKVKKCDKLVNKFHLTGNKLTCWRYFWFESNLLAQQIQHQHPAAFRRSVIKYSDV